jgi:replication factor C small subunit
MKELWVEKYRPEALAEYVFRDEAQKQQVESWVKSGAIPHLLFSGGAGVGKTTLAKVLLHEIDIDWGDVLEINASRERGITADRGAIDVKINNFVSTLPFGEYKIVLLDEVDFMSPNAQATLRSMMEMFHTSARFILTCNYPHKVLPALHSRCQGFHIEHLDETDFMVRLGQILSDEDVEIDIDTLELYVKATYPDLRKCINMCQMNSQTGKLVPPHQNENSGPDYKVEMVQLFKEGKITEARKLICSKANPQEYEDIYKFLYRNLEYWGDTIDQQDEAILVIRDGIVKHAMCADPEINLAACLVQLNAL